jgi:hypothetical protein
MAGGERAPQAARRSDTPLANCAMSRGVAVSKPTTSSIPGSADPIEKPFETMPTTTRRASMPDARR